MNSEVWLGLLGAGLLVLVGNRYIKHRVKKEVKVYGEEQIKNPGDEGEGDGIEYNRTTEGNDNSFERGESETPDEKPDVQRGRFPSDSFKSDKSDTPGNREFERGVKGDSEAIEWDRVAVPDFEQIY